MEDLEMGVQEDTAPRSCEPNSTEEVKLSWPRSWLSWLKHWRTPDDLPITYRSIEEYPLGYPRMAAWMAGDRNFMLYRSYKYLHARSLLEQQHRLDSLEFELERLDTDDAATKDPDILRDRSLDCENESTSPDIRNRTRVLQDIRVELVRYDELLTHNSSLERLQRPSRRDYRDFRNWLAYTKSLPPWACAYIKNKEDILTLRQDGEPGYFNDLIEKALTYFDCWLTRAVFCPQKCQGKTADPNFTGFSPARLEVFGSLVIVIIICVLLVLPVIALYKVNEIYGVAATDSDSVSDSETKTKPSSGTTSQAQAVRAMSILIVFTLVFCVTMRVLTRAKRQELFAACAAYCAVLVVFVSNIS